MGRPKYRFMDRLLKQTILLGGFYYGSMWLINGPLESTVNEIREFEPKNLKLGSSAQDVKNFFTNHPNEFFIGFYTLHSIRSYYNTYGLTERKMDYLNSVYIYNKAVRPWDIPYIVWNDGSLKPVDDEFVENWEQNLDSLLQNLPEKKSHKMIKEAFSKVWEESYHRKYHKFYKQYTAYLFQEILIGFYQSFYYPYYKNKDNQVKKWFKESWNFFNHKIEEKELKENLDLPTFFQWQQRFFE